MLPLSAFFFPFNQLPLNVATNCTFGFCLRLGVLTFFFFFFIYACISEDTMHCSVGPIYCLRDPQILYSGKKNIKNWSHSILHIILL